MTKDVTEKVRKVNYERIFDEARKKYALGSPHTQSDIDNNLASWESSCSFHLQNQYF
jgi:hypothetical protein